MTMNRTMKVEAGGTTFDAKIGTIEKAHLGPEDHGIFTAWLEFGGPNWGQSELVRAWGPEKLVLYMKTVLSVLGVRDWSELRGKSVLVLLDDRGIVAGIAHPMHDRFLIFQELADA